MSARLPDGWVVEYSLTGAGAVADWKSCLDAAKSGSGFLALPGAGMVKLSPELMRFFPAAAGAIRKLDPIGRTFEVPSYAAEYFTFLVRDIPGAVVPELAGGGIGDVPSGYDLQPDFRFEGTLRKYQEEGVRFLQYMTDRNYNVILADEMGLGKTVQLLALLASRKKRGMAPALIVCPASLTDNWRGRPQSSSRNSRSPLRMMERNAARSGRACRSTTWSSSPTPRPGFRATSSSITASASSCSTRRSTSRTPAPPMRATARVSMRRTGLC